ncbi:MAG: response regulator, partial [Pirellulales bacterium]|nr:response regulator [Pirellulales bacterium]
VEVIGHAENGEVALAQIEELKPDLVTLDIEMPLKNGLDVLREIKARGLNTGALMVSSLTRTGASHTT